MQIQFNIQKRLFSILLVLSLTISFSAYTQNYEVSTMEVNNNNYSAYLDKKLFIDKDGFLWYSTYNGVVKEMGSNTSFFFEYASPKDKNIITTNALYQTSNKKLFACTNRGLNILDLDTKTSKWISAIFPNTDIEVVFTSAKEDSKGNVWLGTHKNYLYCYTNKGELVYTKILKSNFPTKNSLIYPNSKMEIIEVLEDDSVIIKQSHKWFQIIDGLNYLIFDCSEAFKMSDNATTILLPNGALFPKNTSGIYTFQNLELNYKYIKSINKQIVEIPYRQGQFIPKPISINFYNALDFISLNERNLVGFRLEETNGNFNLIEVEKFPFKRRISNVLYDKSGYFWLQTEYGISKVRYTGLGFRRHLNNGDISCRGIAEDENGDVNLLTYAGIFKKKKNEDAFLEIESKSKKDYDFVTKMAYNFHKTDDNNYWFYGFHDSLIHFNLKKDKFTYYYFPFQNVAIVDLLQIEDSKFLLASSIGLYEFDLNRKEFKNISDLGNGINLDKLKVNALHLSKDKSTLWIATFSDKTALVKIDRKSNTAIVYNENSEVIPLVSSAIKVIYEDSQNNIWLGTANGLQKINAKDNSIKNYTVQSGLANDNIASILEDDNNIWVATFYGLVRINKENDALQVYYKKDGLTHNEFNITSSYKHTDGKLYFGGLNGVISFSPEKISKINQDNFKIFLIEYEQYDEDAKANKKVVTLNEEVSGFTIPNQNNYLTLKFAINDILNSDKNIYQYRILEISEEWVNLGNYNTLQLHGLNPGSYNVEVRGFSSNGNPTNILEYKLRINQIFYKRAWFIALNIIGVFVFIMLRNKKRRKYLENSFRQKNEIQKLEAKAMRAQMNPHFIFNTLNGMQSVMILKGEREANKYFTAFSRLLRITLDMSNAEYISLKDEIEYLNSYLKLENLRLDNRINIAFNIDSKLDVDNYSIPCMLFQPIIENALIHGLIPKKENLKITINFNMENGFLLAEIIDNGIGRSKALENKKNSTHKSWATHIMNERISISNARMEEKISWDIIDLVDDNNEALGTKVVLKIPLTERVGI